MLEKFVQVSRDPFARFDVIRKVDHSARGGCAWCGGKRRRGGLFVYGVWPDAGRIHWESNHFCSKQCRDCYNG